ETCNAKDGDCNGPTDDSLTDSRYDHACYNRCNDADGANTSSGTRCHPSTYTCVAAARACNGSVANASHTCNGTDHECHGTVDDTLTDVGSGFPCYDNCPGQVAAGCKGECKAGQLGCSAGVKVCTGSTGLTAETCDGKDNDCNGTTDDGFDYPQYTTDPNN